MPTNAVTVHVMEYAALPKDEQPVVVHQNASLVPTSFFDLPKELRDTIYHMIIFDGHAATSLIVTKQKIDCTKDPGDWENRYNPPPSETIGKFAMRYVSCQVYREYLDAVEWHVTHRFHLSSFTPLRDSQLFPHNNLKNLLAYLPASSARRISIRAKHDIDFRDHDDTEIYLNQLPGFQSFVSQLSVLHATEDINIAFLCGHKRFAKPWARELVDEPVLQTVIQTLERLSRLRRYHISYGWVSVYAERSADDVPWQGSSVIRYHDNGRANTPPPEERAKLLDSLNANYIYRRSDLPRGLWRPWKPELW